MQYNNQDVPTCIDWYACYTSSEMHSLITVQCVSTAYIHSHAGFWLSLVPLKLSIRGEHKPSRSPVVDVLTWGGELKTVYMYV